MVRHLGKALSIALLLVAVAARADGMAWVEKAASGGTGELGTAVPTAQRAILERVESEWHLTLEARYLRPKAGAGWLIPFPHCPTVAEADPRVLTELGMLTAPLFVDGCVQACRCDYRHSGGCLSPFGSGDPEAVYDVGESRGSGRLDVEVWQSGTLGALDFVVLSAGTPADVPAWLEQNGYESPPELVEFVAGNAERYRCYFAARLGDPRAEEDVFPAVRFRLDGRDPPFYPLALTGLGMAQGRELDLTIWVVNSRAIPGGGEPPVTTTIPGFPVRRPDCLAPNGAFGAAYTKPLAEIEADYWKCLDDFHDGNPGEVAATFNAPLTERADAFVGARGLYCDPEIPACLFAKDVLSDLPLEWSESARRWMDAGVWVSRLEARLSSGEMKRDMVFLQGGEPGTPCAEIAADGSAGCYAGSWQDGEAAREEPALGGACIDVGLPTGGVCTIECDASAPDCPSEWTCRPGDGGRSLCVPPSEGGASAAWLFSRPDRFQPDYFRIAQSCGLDCSEVCDAYRGVAGADGGTDGRTAKASSPLGWLVLGLPAVALLRRRRRASARGCRPTRRGT